MEEKYKLFMVMLGCTPSGRITEQHDIFFGISDSLKNLVPKMKEFWPEAKGRIHIDAWREISVVDNYTIEITKKQNIDEFSDEKLFFLNLGGYKEYEFEEYHYKVLTVAETLGLASRKSKKTTFYKHCGYKGAESHIDEKFGIDVDDVHNVSELLVNQFKEQYALKITKSDSVLQEDTLHIGYLKLTKIAD